MKLPNDLFKRPGPHHAVEADPDAIAAVRAAVDPLRRYGIGSPLAELLKVTETEVLEEAECERWTRACWAVGAREFGLQKYGPLLEHAGFDLAFGEPLIPLGDPTVEPVSAFWADLLPYLPQHVAKAKDVLAVIPILEQISAEGWEQVHADLTVRHDDAPELEPFYAKAEAEAPLLIAAWKREYPVELREFAKQLRPIARRDGWVMTWVSEQGWL